MEVRDLRFRVDESCTSGTCDTNGVCQPAMVGGNKKFLDAGIVIAANKLYDDPSFMGNQLSQKIINSFSKFKVYRVLCTPSVSSGGDKCGATFTRDDGKPYPFMEINIGNLCLRSVADGSTVLHEMHHGLAAVKHKYIDGKKENGINNPIDPVLACEKKCYHLTDNINLPWKDVNFELCLE